MKTKDLNKKTMNLFIEIMGLWGNGYPDGLRNKIYYEVIHQSVFESQQARIYIYIYKYK